MLWIIKLMHQKMSQKALKIICVVFIATTVKSITRGLLNSPIKCFVRF